MVQANPQILQVWSLSVSNIFVPPFSLWCRFYWCCMSSLKFCTAYASRTRKAKSTASAPHSRASSWLSPLDQWTCWRGRVIIAPLVLMFLLQCVILTVYLPVLGIYCRSWHLQCHRLCLLHQRSVKPLNVYVYYSVLTSVAKSILISLFRSDDDIDLKRNLPFWLLLLRQFFKGMTPWSRLKCYMFWDGWYLLGHGMSGSVGPWWQFCFQGELFIVRGG